MNMLPEPIYYRDESYHLLINRKLFLIFNVNDLT